MIKRTTVVLDEKLLKELKQFALNNNETIADVIRVALTTFLHPHEQIVEDISPHPSPSDHSTGLLKTINLEREKYEG